MKKLQGRFEAVPIAEALRNAGLVDDKKVVEKVEKIEKKKEPYAVPARNAGQSS